MKQPNQGLSPVILFSLRLFFYFSVVTLILVHPGISVSFDRIGAMQWFVIIPLMSIVAFQSVFAFNLYKKTLTALIMLLPLSFIAAGFSLNILILIFSGIISFTLTLILFHGHRIHLLGRFAKAAALEPFFLAWVILRLLSLSRSGEEIAGQSILLTQFMLVWVLTVFLSHSAVIYLCLYPASRKKAWKEGIVFFLCSLAVLLVVLVALPPDFVRNTIIQNLNPDRIPERIRSSETDLDIPANRTGSRQGGELRGVSENEWTGRGESRQYMVKIVASEIEPVYMCDIFRGQLDPVHGFLPSPQEPLNDISRQRLFVTWFNNEYNFDTGRSTHEFFSLSTLQQKYLPYVPVSVDPVILHENTGPLRYIHQVVSNTHTGDPLALVKTPSRLFSEFEKHMLSPYLEISLEENDKKEFELYLYNALDTWKNYREEIIRRDRYLSHIFSGLERQSGNMYLENIIAILNGFSQFQYNLVYDDNYSIAALKEFLFIKKEGDCVEFSNTLALLGRIAGIPSRVVTGYLAAEQLQTAAHLRGIAHLRSRIPVLQQFPFENLFLVTNLHSHSWVQFYIPDYGWIDFEATSFAIPPMGMGDFNNWDVVIPLFDENRTFSQIRRFPWQAVGRTVIIIIILGLICAYILRYSRELILYFGAKNNTRAGARSLYLLLLARLAADGNPIKPASKTAHEYSELFQGRVLAEPSNLRFAGIQKNGEMFIKDPYNAFAEIYSMLRWREFKDKDEFEIYFLKLKIEYYNILSMRKRGLHHIVKRIFNLKGLAYL